jgi:hypothetical protein
MGSRHAPLADQFMHEMKFGTSCSTTGSGASLSPTESIRNSIQAPSHTPSELKKYERGILPVGPKKAHKHPHFKGRQNGRIEEVKRTKMLAFLQSGRYQNRLRCRAMAPRRKL